MVHVSELQSRLINDGVPVDRAMSLATEIGAVPVGGRYRLERAAGPLYFYVTVNPGYLAVASE